MATAEMSTTRPTAAFVIGPRRPLTVWGGDTPANRGLRNPASYFRRQPSRTEARSPTPRWVDPPACGRASYRVLRMRVREDADLRLSVASSTFALASRPRRRTPRSGHARSPPTARPQSVLGISSADRRSARLEISAKAGSEVGTGTVFRGSRSAVRRGPIGAERGGRRAHETVLRRPNRFAWRSTLRAICTRRQRLRVGEEPKRWVDLPQRQRRPLWEHRAEGSKVEAGEPVTHDRLS